MSTNPNQHTTLGGHLEGYHPTHWSDPLARDNTRLALYERFLRPGDLAFDIGANIGEVTRVMLALGARVVAVEPQPAIAGHIPPEATVVNALVGHEHGSRTFYEVPASPYLSTTREDLLPLIERMNQGWQAFPYERPVVTLDELIAEHGVPAFTKIDVEGGEVDVFLGLSQPLPALSFEVHSFDAGKIPKCLELLENLGKYTYTYSRGESYILELWPPAELTWFGDIYAILQP